MRQRKAQKIQRAPEKKLLDSDVAEAERAAADLNPLYLLYGGYLTIKDKAGRVRSLRMNTSQKMLFDKINKLRKENKPIRIWLLKYRQGGVSTFLEALIYCLTSRQAGHNSLIMADEEDKSNYLFEMSKLYQEGLEQTAPYLANPIKKSNAKKLEFEGLKSQIIIETANNPDACRAFTYQYVHLSEVAFFPDLKRVMAGLSQSVPDHGDTLIVGETTANGMNFFYEEWMRAVRGETDWIPVFLPWYMMEEYRMPLEGGEMYPLDGIKFNGEFTERDFLATEADLVSEHKVDSEQLNWRRFAIVNKCQGDIITFQTEYPATYEEAFSMSGSMYFDRAGMKHQVAEAPIAVGNLFYQNMKWTFREMPEGKIEIYERPELNEEYVITSDSSEGIDKDEAGILVLNKRLNTTAAVVYGQYTPEEIAAMCIALGNYYNKGIVAPENKGYGYMVCQLVNSEYGNVYRRIVTTKGIEERREELGFNTNAVTRPQMLAQMNEEIRHNTTVLRSKRLISECSTFIIKRDKEGKIKKIEAQTGCQDALVICRAIAGIVRDQHPYRPKVVTGVNSKISVMANEKRKRSNGGFGFDAQ